MARLQAKDIDSLINSQGAKSPQGTGILGGLRTEEVYAEAQKEERDNLVTALSSYDNQSVAKNGDVLPPPPRTSLINTDGKVVIQANPYSATTTTKAVVQGDAHPHLLAPAAIRGLDLDQIQSRADLVRLITPRIPLNDLGLPTILYRGDLLDWRLFAKNSSVDISFGELQQRYEDMEACLSAATVHLDYAQGFPALPSGEALWGQLPFETKECFNAFSEYCTMPGARELQRIISFPTPLVINMYHEGYWAIRAQCFDMMSAVHAAKKREQRIMACDDDHYLRAENVLNKLQALGESVNWEKLADDPEKYVNVMEKAIKLQRQVLGIISANGNGGNGFQQKQVESLEVSMRKVVNPDGAPMKQRKDGEGFDVRKLLQDPSSLATAQELIIKMTRSLETQSNTPSSED